MLSIWINATIFFFIFFFSNSLVKAALSITTVMSCITILLLLKQNGEKLILDAYSCLENRFKFSYWIFFILLIIASILVNDFESIKKAFKFLYYSLPFWLMLIITYKNFDKYEITIQKSILISSLLIGILALYYFTKLPEGVRLSLFNFGPNAIAALLEINLPFVIIIAYNAFSKNLSIIYKFISCSAALLCIFALVATGSRGALIGFFAGLVILFLIKIKIAKQWSFNIKKVSIIMLLGICFVGSVFLKTDFQLVRSYDMERVRLVESSYNMWKDNKLLGVGLNNWRENYVSKYILPDARERLDFPHNTVAYFFSASGIIGGIGFLIFTFGILAFLINVLKLDYNNIYIQAMLWAFIAFSVHGLFDLGFLMKQSERLIFTYLGITCANIIFKTYYLNKDNK